MLIQVITGGETFGSEVAGAAYAGTFKVLAFYRHPSRPAVEIPLATATRDRMLDVKEIGRTETMNAAARNRQHGQWNNSRYHVPQFSIIKIMISRKVHGDFIQHTKSFLLRMREGAASRRLRIPFTGNPHASIVCGYIEGRFDILTPELFDYYKLEIPEQFAQTYDVDDPGEWFEETIVEAEATPLTTPDVSTVTTEKGNTLKVVRNVGRRLIKVKGT